LHLSCQRLVANRRFSDKPMIRKQSAARIVIRPRRTVDIDPVVRRRTPGALRQLSQFSETFVALLSDAAGPNLTQQKGKPSRARQ